MKLQLRSLMASSAVHMVFAFAAMGSWAAFANRTYPMPAPIQAGVIQGALSAVITLLLKRGVEALSNRFTGQMALLGPPLVAVLVSAGLLAAFHTIGGTPEILRTITVPLTVSTAYAALYNLSLWRDGKV